MTGLPGFAESQTPFAEATLGPDGRVLIPAALRDAAGIQRGDDVTIRVEDGRIILTSFKAEIRRIQGMLAHLKRPGESIVDEFIAEKRAEAERE